MTRAKVRYANVQGTLKKYKNILIILYYTAHQTKERPVFENHAFSVCASPMRHVQDMKLHSQKHTFWILEKQKMKVI